VAEVVSELRCDVPQPFRLVHLNHERCISTDRARPVAECHPRISAPRRRFRRGTPVALEKEQLPGAERARGSNTDNEVNYVEWN